MSVTSPKLNLPLIAPSQAMKHITHNEALMRLDAITQLSVVSLGTTTPPASPVAGACYGIGAAAQGDWAGHDGALTSFFDGGWHFVTPQAGWRLWNLDTTQLMVFSGGVWMAIDTSFNNVDGLGINTSFDPTNRLALSSPASLFNHEGAGHQLKVNKAAAADTASLVFQSGFTGHAEIGLVGDNDLAFKVSDDGSTFHEGVRMRNTDGLTSVPVLRSGLVTVLEDTVASITPPGDGGMVFISQVNPRYPQVSHSGIFSYDTGLSLNLFALANGSGFTAQGGTALTGTTGPVNRTNVAVQSDAILIENRYNDEGHYAYTFLNTY